MRFKNFDREYTMFIVIGKRQLGALFIIRVASELFIPLFAPIFYTTIENTQLDQ